MPMLARNHKQIMAAKPLNGKRTRFTIEGVRGLILDVFTTGRRVWYVRYEVGRGKLRRSRSFRIGNAAHVGLSDAIDKCRAVMAGVEVEGIDPQLRKRLGTTETKTFGELFEGWYERHALVRLARPRDERMKYENHLKKTLGDVPIPEIKRIDVAKLRDRLVVESGPVSSNNIVTLFNRVMNWAVDEGLIEFNPAHRLRKVGLERPRERVLSETEIKVFWQALERLDTATDDHIKQGKPGRMLSLASRCALRIMMLTGQRRAEVAGIRKSEIDLTGSRPVWTIPSLRTKNRLLHRVPLAPMAKAQFEMALAASRSNSEYLFPTLVLDGRDAPMIPEAITRAMVRLCAELRISGAGPHDLRRTVGTQLAMLGVPLHVRSLVLNHSSQNRGVTDVVYNRYGYDKEKLEAFERWEGHLGNIIAARPSAGAVGSAA